MTQEGDVFPLHARNVRTRRTDVFAASVEGDLTHIADHAVVFSEPHTYAHEWMASFKTEGLRAAVTDARAGKVGRIHLVAEPHRAPPTFDDPLPGKILHRGVMKVKQRGSSFWFRPPNDCIGFVLTEAELSKMLDR